MQFIDTPLHSPETKTTFRPIAAVLICLILCLPPLVCGCGASRSEPQSDSPGAIPASVVSQYPSSQYLTARGTGQSEPEARRRALSALSNIFESRIASELDAKTKSVVDTQKGDHFEKQVAETVRVQSSVRLQGAEIGDTWQTNGTCHALAVLNRGQAADQWTAEIQNLDSTIAGQIRSYRNLKSPILKLQAIDRIMRRWLDKQVLESRLRVIGAGYNSPVDRDIQKTLKKLPAIKSRLRIFAAISGTRSEAIQNRIVRSLADKGYVFTDRKTEADVVLQGTTEVKPLDLNRQDWEFVRAIVTVSIMDASSGDQVGRIAKNTRAAHLNIDEATRKALDKIAGQVADAVVDQFVTAGQE